MRCLRYIPKLIFVIFLFIVMNAQEQFGQIGAYAGHSNTLLLDEYVSKNSYRGSSFLYGFRWQDINEKRNLGVILNYHENDPIEFSFSRAEFKDFSFHYFYLYHQKDFNLFDNAVGWSIGPEIETYFHHRSQQDAISKTSIVIYVATDIAARFQYAYSDEIQFINYTSLTIFAYIVKNNKANAIGTQEAPVGFLFLPELTRYRWNISANYIYADWLVISFGYELNYKKINRWDPFRMLQDRFLIGLDYRF
jgi:hypothetical protein